MPTIPSHVKALTTGEDTQAIWIHVLKSLLDVPDDNDPTGTAVSLANIGIASFKDLVDLSASCHDGFIGFLDRSLSVDMAVQIKAIISLFNDWTYTCGAIIDMRTVSYEDFQAYCGRSYNPEYPLGVFQQLRQRRDKSPSTTVVNIATTIGADTMLAGADWSPYGRDPDRVPD